MNQQKKNTPWKKTHIAEKIGLLAGWAVIAAILWYWLTPGQPPPAEPPTNVIAQAPPPATIHTFASTQALMDATQYLSELDEAMAQGMPILKANNLSELTTHSQVFKALLEAGRVQFGQSVFEPLGHCSSADVFANSCWQAQVISVRQGGTESIPGAIQSSLNEYRQSGAECLEQAALSINAASVNEKNTCRTESALEC